MTATAGPAYRATMLRVIAWLIERHHQSLGLWPWTWTGPDDEAYVTLYARCTSERFGDDFAALASWVEAQRWPPPDDTPHPATLSRVGPSPVGWAVAPPRLDGGLPPPRHADIEQLARGGASIDTLAQLLEAASGLDDYLAMLAPRRHGGHPHRGPAGTLAVTMVRLATDLALSTGLDYQVPWTGPRGGLANGISDPDWPAFQARFHLARLPFVPAAQDVFLFDEHGWLHAAGWAGDTHGTIIQVGPHAQSDAGYAALLAAITALWRREARPTDQ